MLLSSWSHQCVFRVAWRTNWLLYVKYDWCTLHHPWHNCLAAGVIYGTWKAEGWAHACATHVWGYCELHELFSYVVWRIQQIRDKAVSLSIRRLLWLLFTSVWCLNHVLAISMIFDFIALHWPVCAASALLTVFTKFRTFTMSVFDTLIVLRFCVACRSTWVCLSSISWSRLCHWMELASSATSWCSAKCLLILLPWSSWSCQGSLQSFVSFLQLLAHISTSLVYFLPSSLAGAPSSSFNKRGQTSYKNRTSSVMPLLMRVQAKLLHLRSPW